MLRRFGLILILANLVLSVACTEKGKPYWPNAPDTRKPAQPTAAIEPEDAKPSAEANKWQTQYDSAKDPLTQVLLPLADRVLDTKRVTDPKSLRFAGGAGRIDRLQSHDSANVAASPGTA